jgi:membrane associated rhomboid family serine protease
MSETELSVICKNCGSEVSPYVTECPYCGARLRKRAPKLERRGDALEAKPRRRGAARFLRRRASRAVGARALRSYATMGAIGASAALLLVQKATGETLAGIGGLTAPLDGEWWRFLTAPFAYVDVGYLFVIAIGLAIFGSALERRLGSLATGVLLVACGSLGMVAASAVANAQGHIEVIGGGNGMALGAVAAWFTLRRAEAHGEIDQEYDAIGVAVATVVLLALPLFDSDADVVAGVAGGLVGGLAGLAASVLRSSE